MGFLAFDGHIASLYLVLTLCSSLDIEWRSCDILAVYVTWGFVSTNGVFLSQLVVILLT